MQKTDNKFIEIIGKEQIDLYFSYLERCKDVKQMEKHHPEGDVLNHSLQCLCWAFKESYDIDLILAAMLHDIGKIDKAKGARKRCMIRIDNKKDTKKILTYVGEKVAMNERHTIKDWDKYELEAVECKLILKEELPLGP